MKSILVAERDGLDINAFIIHIEPINIPDDFDSIMKAVTDACNEYVQTEEGKKIYIGNCDCFNWADFEAYVPKEICKKHGFTFTSTPVSDYEVDWDTQLVTEFENDEEEI